MSDSKLIRIEIRISNYDIVTFLIILPSKTGRGFVIFYIFLVAYVNSSENCNLLRFLLEESRIYVENSHVVLLIISFIYLFFFVYG